MASTVTPHPVHGPGSLRDALSTRVVVADGAMGTMLQAADPTLDDFQGHEGCNEILSITRPELVQSVHDAYFEVGVDCVETNTFGANYANLGEYGIEDRIYELSEAAAAIARRSADSWSTPEQPRWVIGSVGPGTKLPSLGHAPFALLRDAYEEEVAGLVAGGADAILVETAQDLLQAKAAIIGARRALSAAGMELPLFAQVTVETTGTMLLGTEIGAALTALEPLGIDMIGLNCATGPSEMSEHLRTLARTASIGVSCMPNAGLPILTSDGAYYPAHAARAGGCARHVHARLRAVPRRRLLRDHARAPQARGRARARAPDHAPRRAQRPVSRIALPVGSLPAGHVIPVDRRAYECRRLTGLPRRNARAALGGLHRDRAQPDP